MLRMFLLFAAFLVNCQASPLHCSSVEPFSSGSDVINLAQVTTTQYCFIDDCTISRIDSGQKLDIIDTTESVIVVIPRGNQTAVALAKLQTASPCSTSRSTISAIPTGQFTMLITLSILIAMVSGYNAFIHLVFKQLRNPFEKLMLLYSVSIIIQFTIFIFLLLMSHMIAMNSQLTCHVTIILFMTLSISTESYAVCLLIHLAYLVYHSYKMMQISKNKNKCLFCGYVAFVLCTVVLSIGSGVVFDFLTGSGRYILLSNGFCNYYNKDFSYKTLVILLIVAGLYKTTQIIVFVIYLHYFYKLTTESFGDDGSVLNRWHNSNLIKIAVAMGATIGISYFIYLFNTPLAEVSGIALLFIQQCIIVASLQKIFQLSKTKDAN